MNGSVGQALREARVAKKLSIEEAARATKIRPERIADLEQDDYMRFPNIVYARNFLILYAKYLGVDISRYPTLEIGFDTGVGEYSYLQQNEEGTVPVRRRRRRAAALPPEKPRWLIAFFILVVALAAGALIGWSVITIKRLGPVEPAPHKGSATPSPAPTSTPEPPAPSPAMPSPAAMPGGDEAPPPVSRGPSEPVIRAVPAVSAASPTGTPAPTPVEEAVATPSPVAVPVTGPNPVAEASGSPSPTPALEGEDQEVAIRSNRKIRLRVVRDDPNSPSAYYGSLNPLMKPLVFVGKHFWIKTAEPDALEVTIGGKPAPSSAVEVIPAPGI